MQFEDIEMLDIPESDVSGTEPVSGSDTPAIPDKSYPSLQEWLSGEKDLDFQFSPDSYKASVEQRGSEPSIDYINRLYKVMEEMKSETCAAHDFGFPGSLGVVSSSQDISGGRHVPRYTQTAFSAILSTFMAYYEGVMETLAEPDARDLTRLVSILECLHANSFYGSDRTRPELILKWINNFDPKPENDFIDSVMYSTPSPWKHPQFWTSYLGTLLSRGMFERASSSIAASKYQELESECPGLYEIIEDLKTLVGAYAGMALKGQFIQWKQKVCEMRDNFGNLKAEISDMAHVTIASQIHDLLRLMSGMPKTAASFVSTWYEMYGCLALFQVRDDNTVYPDYFRIAIAEKGYNAAEPIEDTFRDIVSGNYLRVILAIDQCDSPTAAYVSKVFDACGFFQQFYSDMEDSEVGPSQRGNSQPADDSNKSPNKEETSQLGKTFPRQVSDFLLIRHAFACLEKYDLVPVGIGLLVSPIVTGFAEQSREVLSEFLPQHTYLTNDDLEWALTICAKLKMPEVSKKLFMKQGLDSLEDGHLFEALNMLVRSYDDVSGTEDDSGAMAHIHSIVWDSLFGDALMNSSPVPDELISNVVTNQVSPDFPVHPIIRQCLAPYAVLCDYLLSVPNSETFSKSLSALFHLVRFKYMPERFVPLLLAQFLPFFQARSFDLPQLIIMIELIDTFEMQEMVPEDEELYIRATESVPADTPWDWRVELKKQGQELPKTVKALVKELRNKIVRNIGEVYITM